MARSGLPKPSDARLQPEASGAQSTVRQARRSSSCGRNVDRHTNRQRSPYGRRPEKRLRHAPGCTGRCAQPRPEAHGERIQGDQRSPDRMDANLPRPIRDIPCRASIYYRCTLPAPALPALGQRHDTFVRWPVLPRERPSRKARRHQYITVANPDRSSIAICQISGKRPASRFL
jgi:hypothetical protein